MSQNDYIVAPMNCQGQFGIPGIPGALYDCDNWNTTDALSPKRSDLGIDTQMVDARVVLQPTDPVTWSDNARYERQAQDGTSWKYKNRRASGRERVCKVV